MNQLQLTALPNIPLIVKDDNLVELILHGLTSANIILQPLDIIVIAQKIISKTEGRYVSLSTVKPSVKALDLAAISNKDPRLIELILAESMEVLRVSKSTHQTTGHIIVRHRLGFVMANAGIDMSNVNQEEGKDEIALLLPENPDQSCEQLRSGLRNKTGVDVGIIINDSHGRAWRNGTVGVALGVSGLDALLDLRGQPDLFNRKLKSTQVGFGDELSAAASLLMGQANESTPIVHIRGLKFTMQQGTVQTLLRSKDKDLFL